jgi:GTP pyrophosphokinase
MASLVARHIMSLVEVGNGAPPLLDRQGNALQSKAEPVIIVGNVGSSVQLGSCCLPIPGDQIIGQLKQDQALIVHTQDCDVTKRYVKKEPDRWIEVQWGNDLDRRFECRLKILMLNDKGVLARIASEINESDADIVYVGMDTDHDQRMMQLRFTVRVDDRVHLARLMRNIRGISSVTRILRERNN